MKIGMIVAMDKELKQLRPLFPDSTNPTVSFPLAVQVAMVMTSTCRMWW